MRFPALAALQKVYGLSPQLLQAAFYPLIQEYRRLSMAEGAVNSLWQEYQLIRGVLRNNGVYLSLPEIDMKK